MWSMPQALDTRSLDNKGWTAEQGIVANCNWIVAGLTNDSADTNVERTLLLISSQL